MKFEAQLVLMTQVRLHFLLLNSHFFGSSHPEVLLGGGYFGVMQKICGGAPVPGCNFNEVAK